MLVPSSLTFREYFRALAFVDIDNDKKLICVKSPAKGLYLKMNDFLQSLRNGQVEKQRSQKTRKNYDNSYHYSNSRFHSYGGGYPGNRGQQGKKGAPQQQPGNQIAQDESATTSMLTEAIETLSYNIEEIASNQRDMIDVQEKIAQMMERQALVLEQLLDQVNPAAGRQERKTLSHSAQSQENQADEVQLPEPVLPESDRKGNKSGKTKGRSKKAFKPSKPEIPSGEGLKSRDEIMDIIYKMRSEGATFEKVAEHLIELGQPTFSGRGEWHAQTIHRLCSKK